jgi:hypothetical protein
VKEFKIENTSKVVFEYTVRLDHTSPRSNFMKKFIGLTPAKGMIKGGEI